MLVVVDAGVVVALFVADPRRAAARALLDRWVESGDELHAPAVLLYEVMNVLARHVWDGGLAAADADAVWADLDALGIKYDAFNAPIDGPRALAIARTLHRRHATDCAYVSLAERLATHVWTLDESFARAASGADLPVVLVS